MVGLTAKCWAWSNDPGWEIKANMAVKAYERRWEKMENPLYKHIGEVAPQKERKGGRQGCGCYCSEEGEEEKPQKQSVIITKEEIAKKRKEMGKKWREGRKQRG